MRLRLRSSGHAKWLDLPVGAQWPDLELGNSHIEYALVKLFQIDIIQLIKVKAILSKQFHIQPSEIDMMPYWEYEYYLRALNDSVEEENQKQQEEMDKYHINDYMKMAHPSSLNKMMANASPKMPNISIGNMSMGSMKF